MEQSPSPSNDQSRHALTFRMPEADENTSKTMVEDDDSFYDLTMDEVKALFSEIQKQKAIDDKLLPRAKREEEEMKLRPPSYDYKNTVIRIEFPDRMVLQGQFKISETINDVKEFVRDHVKEPGAGFELFTSPPKSILPDEAKLVDLQLVPTAKLYIGIQNGGSCILKSDQMAVVPFDCAQEAAKTVRRPAAKEETKPGPSKPRAPERQEASSSNDVQPSKKVPKWFKMKK